MRSDFGFGLFVGIFGGIAAVLLVAAATSIWGATDSAWLYRWQTLVAAMIALGSALLAVRMIERQIQQADKLEQGRIYRRAISARVLLPNALAELSEYAEQCIADLRNISGMSSVANLAEFKPPVPAKETMGVLSACVEWDDNLRKALIELATHLQVQQSRIQSLAVDQGRPGIRRTTMVGPAVAQFIVDALELYARCDALFEYARGEDNSQPLGDPYREDLQRIAASLRLQREAFPEVHKLIEVRFKERPSAAEVATPRKRSKGLFTPLFLMPRLPFSKDRMYGSQRR